MSQSGNGPQSAVGRLGDELVAAWRRQEASRRRRKRILGLTAAVLGLVISSAVAASSLLIGTPGPNQNTKLNGHSVILTTGSTPTGGWQMTTFRRGAVTCFGLRAVADQHAFYGDDCDPDFPGGHQLTTGTQSTPGQTFVYGATTVRASSVRVTLAGVTFTAALERPAPANSGTKPLPAGLLIFVIRTAGQPDGAPTVALVKAGGRAIKVP